MTKIIQWNINSVKNQYEQLQELVIKENVDLVCLQETNLKINQTIKIKNYSCFNKIRVNCLAASGGASILVNMKHYHKELNLNTEMEAIAIQTMINNTNLTICNIYINNKYEMNINELENLIDQLPQPFLITGDFNSHNTLWGSHKTDIRGKIIEKLIISRNLILLNNLQPTHFNLTTGNTSVIDLTICSCELAVKMEWKVLDYLYNSDHYPIIVTFNEELTSPTIHTPKWKFHKADWTHSKTSLTLI